MGTWIVNTILLLLFVPIGLLFAQDAKADPLQDYFANAIAVAQESLDQQAEAAAEAALEADTEKYWYCYDRGLTGNDMLGCKSQFDHNFGATAD